MSTQPSPIDYASPGAIQQPKSKRWIAITFFMLMRSPDSSSVAGVSFGTFRQDLASGNVQSIVVFSDELEYTTHRSIQINSPVQAASAATVTRVRLAQDMGRDWRFTQWLIETGNAQRNMPAPDIRFNNQQNLVVNLLLPLIPWLLIFAFIYFFVFRVFRQQQATLTNPTPVHVIIANPEALRS
jgi:ATP-dependent Zn protease